MVLTGISDPRLCLVFGVHSLHAVMYVLTHWQSTDWFFLEKVLKKTPLDLQKRFLIFHACPKYVADSPLRAPFIIFKISRIAHKNNSILWFLNLGCEFKDSVSIFDQFYHHICVECGPLKSLQMFHLIETFLMSFTKIPILISKKFMKNCWSRRSCSSPARAWLISYRWNSIIPFNSWTFLLSESAGNSCFWISVVTSARICFCLSFKENPDSFVSISRLDFRFLARTKFENGSPLTSVCEKKAQLSVYGAVAAVCEEFESHQDRSGEPEILMVQSIVLGEVKSRSSFAKRKSHEWPDYLAAVHSTSWIAFTRKQSE